MFNAFDVLKAIIMLAVLLACVFSVAGLVLMVRDLLSFMR